MKRRAFTLSKLEAHFVVRPARPPTTPAAQEWMVCARKRLLLTQQDAIDVAKIMELKYNTPFNGYACHYCGGYHVGRIVRTYH